MKLNAEFRFAFILFFVLILAVGLVSYRNATHAAVTSDCTEKTNCVIKKPQADLNLLESISHNLLSTSTDGE